jgi:tetratricopeptide (TPR) repeat protein
MSQPTQIIRKQRYKQNAELELIHRLNDSHCKQRWYHPATIDTAMRLARILGLQGRYRSAELLFKQCADHLEKTFGEKNPRTLVASSQLSRVYVQQGQLAKGEKLSRLVYSRASEVFNPSNRDFLCIKINFAYCIAILGDFTESERLLREAMSIGGAVLPNDDPVLLECARYLAELLRIRGELDEAEEILLPNVDSRTSNRDISDHLQTRASLGDEYEEFPKAIQPLGEFHETQKQLIGSNHDQSLDTGKNPGLMSREPGTFVEGEELLRDSINRSAKTLWMKHPLVSDAMQPLTSPETVSQVSQKHVWRYY